MMPVITTPNIALVEIRENERVAWTRSSSPGPASTTRATSATPPNQTPALTQVAEADQHAEPGRRALDAAERHGDQGGARQSPRPHRGGGVDDPLGTHRHPAAAGHEHQPQQRAAAGPAGVGEVEPGARAHRRSERDVAGAGRERDEVEDRAEQGDHPHRAQVAHGHHVLGAFRPAERDQREAAEQGEDAERRQQPAEPQRAAARPLVGRVGRRRRGTGGHRDGEERVGGGGRCRRRRWLRWWAAVGRLAVDPERRRLGPGDGVAVGVGEAPADRRTNPSAPAC